MGHLANSYVKFLDKSDGFSYVFPCFPMKIAIFRSGMSHSPAAKWRSQASRLQVVAALARFEGLQGFEEEEQHFQTQLGGRCSWHKIG